MVPRSKWLASFMAAVFMFSAAGCWDRVEPEERGFVIAAAVDKPEEGEEGNYRITYQFVNPGRMSTGSGQSGLETSMAGKPFYNVSGTAFTVDEFNQKITSRTSRTPFFQHLMLLVISDEIARDQKAYADVLDFYISNEEMRRTNQVFIAEGKAYKILELEHPSERLPALYLRSIAENTRNSLRMAPQRTIGDIQMYLLIRRGYALQKVTSRHHEANMDGAAVFSGKTGKLAGYLNSTETKGLNFITEKLRVGVIEMKVQGEYANLKILSVRKKIKAHWRGERDIRFTVQIRVEGDITEKFGKLDLSDQSVIRELEKTAEREIAEAAAQAVNRSQKKYKCDIFGFSSVLEQSHYRQWLRVKDRWDGEGGYFEQSRIKITSDVKIRRTGLANKTE